MSKERGTLIVFSGPSGVGKGTVLAEYKKCSSPFFYSISATTRSPRPGEVHGVNYYFVTNDEFEKMISNNKLFEYAQYVGNYYGTPTEPVFKSLDNGLDVILEIDTKGAMQIKEKCPEAILVFIAPPSTEELRHRLEGRGTEARDKIEMRMQEAIQEMNRMSEFDYIIINNIVDDAAKELEAIIKAEKCRTAKRIQYIK